MVISCGGKGIHISLSSARRATLLVIKEGTQYHCFNSGFIAAPVCGVVIHRGDIKACGSKWDLFVLNQERLQTSVVSIRKLHLFWSYTKDWLFLLPSPL